MAELLARKAHEASTATPPHKVEQEAKMELLRKARVVRERLANRGAEITGQNPAKAYMWVNIREDRQMYYRAIGWVPCNDPQVKSPYRQEDGTHRRADVLLYEIARDFFEALEADNALRGLEGIDGHQSSFIAGLHQQGVKEYRPQV